mmetsp:Transcript_45829/g.115904  ORF Transcript_45829/g.115904 Transcript_45829/m.115904 type:complete len:434 (-) Transcript_45829:265-1566(-)
MSRSIPQQPIRNRDAHEALSAALLGKQFSQQTNMGSEGAGKSPSSPAAAAAEKAEAGSRRPPAEDAQDSKDGQPFKKRKTGKAWNEGMEADELERSPTPEPEAKPVAMLDSGREAAPSPPSRDGKEARRSLLGAAKGEAKPAAGEKPASTKSKIQMLKNKMRQQTSRSNINVSNAAAAGLPQEEPRGSPRPVAAPKAAGKPGSSDAHKQPAKKPVVPGKKRGLKPKVKEAEEEEEEAAERAEVRPGGTPTLGGQRSSAFLSYQAVAPGGEGEPSRRSAPGGGNTGLSDDMLQDKAPTERLRPAAHVAQALQQRQCCWQGKVKHKLKDSLVELFHLAAVIPAEVAEQFPPSLYVSELCHRSEVTLSSHIWARCSARSLTEKQTNKLQLLSDNKLVAIIRLQHCELILVPDFEPSTGSIRMAGFLMAGNIYDSGR